MESAGSNSFARNLRCRDWGLGVRCEGENVTVDEILGGGVWGLGFGGTGDEDGGLFGVCWGWEDLREKKREITCCFCFFMANE